MNKIKTGTFFILLALSFAGRAQCSGGDGTNVRVYIADADDTLKRIKCKVNMFCTKAGENWNYNNADNFSIAGNCSGVDYLNVTPPIIYDGLYKGSCRLIKNNLLLLTLKNRKDVLLVRFERNGNRPIPRHW